MSTNRDTEQRTVGHELIQMSQCSAMSAVVQNVWGGYSLEELRYQLESAVEAVNELIEVVGDDACLFDDYEAEEAENE